MLRKLLTLCLTMSMVFSCASCASANATDTTNETVITLSDDGVTVNGAAVSTDASSAVYVGAEIVYYESGHDDTYGEGTQADEHSADEAAAHTVITITQPGTYRLTGTLSAGQVAVDLGENAASDPDAVVTLILDNVDLTCTVAPAILFYNVYECGSSEPETASQIVDTSAAGANVILADNSVNDINGAYVARIYQEGTTKKLHKYDGAFYSKMSMNITGELQSNGILNIVATDEGLDSELHLTINGGVIHITADNDGINTNEDGVSVTTINGGTLTINAGLGAEGDGIDSNGYLVMNGGTVITAANGKSGDGGIDSDMGIYLNGGTMIALGSRNDAVEAESQQAYMELSFASTLPSGSVISIQDSQGNSLFSYTAEKEFFSATFTSPELKTSETYAVYVNGVQQQYTGTGMGGPGGMGGPRPDMPENGELSENVAPGQTPKGEMTPPDGDMPSQPPEETEARQPGEGRTPGESGGKRPNNMGNQQDATSQGGSTDFTLTETVHSFSGVSSVTDAATDKTKSD